MSKPAAPPDTYYGDAESNGVYINYPYTTVGSYYGRVDYGPDFGIEMFPGSAASDSLNTLARDYAMDGYRYDGNYSSPTPPAGVIENISGSNLYGYRWDHDKQWLLFHYSHLTFQAWAPFAIAEAHGTPLNYNGSNGDPGPYTHPGQIGWGFDTAYNSTPVVEVNVGGPAGSVVKPWVISGSGGPCWWGYDSGLGYNAFQQTNGAVDPGTTSLGTGPGWYTIPPAMVSASRSAGLGLGVAGLPPWVASRPSPPPANSFTADFTEQDYSDDQTSSWGATFQYTWQRPLKYPLFPALPNLTGQGGEVRQKWKRVVY